MPKSDPPPDAGVNIEDQILLLLQARRPGKSICPSEVARVLASKQSEWRELMPEVRRVARRLAESGQLVVTRDGIEVDATSPGGPIRLALPRADRFAIWEPTKNEA
ncbi:DUF3253 domain-containing protein [Variovorax sp.]|jgi:hypothetical protein|uniref:DUF3253 domain-containing protein n=1 Tax=Variovorax sp. TaxID=1871043 RepID=UPI0037DA78C2